jgi:hypothetical protein
MGASYPRMRGLFGDRRRPLRRSASTTRHSAAPGKHWSSCGSARPPLPAGGLIRLLTGSGDACQATGDLPAARQAWQQAQQIRGDLHLPEDRRNHARPGHTWDLRLQPAAGRALPELADMRAALAMPSRTIRRAGRRLSEVHFRDAQVRGRFCVADMSLRRGLAQVTCVTPRRLRRTQRLR